MLNGARTTQGSRFFVDAPPAISDTTLVERFKKAGVIIFGKTTTPELGLAPSTETSLTGATRNPGTLRFFPAGPSGRGPRRGGRGHRPTRAWQRRRGLDPHSRLLLWAVRTETRHARARPLGPWSERAGAASPSITSCLVRCATAPPCSTSSRGRRMATLIRFSVRNALIFRKSPLRRAVSGSRCREGRCRAQRSLPNARAPCRTRDALWKVSDTRSRKRSLPGIGMS